MAVRSAVSKIGFLLGGLILFLLAAIVILPFVVDVDQYRPQIVRLANDRLNGRLELGRLSLSLWGRLRVQVEGVRLSDSSGRQLVTVDDAYFHFPWAPLFSGNPVVTFHMNEPKVNVVKTSAGDIGLLRLLKETKQPSSPSGSDSAPPRRTGAAGEKRAEASAETIALPALVLSARLGVEFFDAFVSYHDEQSGLKNELRHLNIALKDISLSRPMSLEAGAELSTRLNGEGTSVDVTGPIRLKATVQPEFEGAKLQKAGVSFSLDLSGLDVSAPGAFHKKRGVTAAASGMVDVSQEQARISEFLVRFHNLEVRMSGGVKNLGGEPEVRLIAKSNDFAFEPWRELVPALAQYDVAGKGQVAVDISGKTDRLVYRSDVNFSGVNMKAPGLKVRPQMDLSLTVEPERVHGIRLTMKAPGTDIVATGEVRSFEAPAVTFNVVSTSLDLDQLLDVSSASTGKTGAAAETVKPAAGKRSESGPESNYDAMLAPLKANPYAAKASFKGDFRFNKVVFTGTEITVARAKVAYAGFKGKLDDLSFKVFDGTFKGGADLDLNPQRPAYVFKLNVKGMDLRKAVAANMEAFRNTLYGSLDFEIEGSGSSLDPDTAKRNLKAKGRMNATDATFVTIDVARMATEAVNGGIEKAAGKIAALRGKSLSVPKARETAYRSIGADFLIGGGRFSTRNFAARAKENQGLDLTGALSTGLIDRTLEARFEVVDTYNLTKARDVSAELKGVKIESILAEKGRPVVLPISVRGTIDEPKYGYTEVPEHFSRVALANTKNAATGAVKAEARKKAESAAKKALEKTSPAVRDKLKKLGGSLFKR